MKDTAGKKYDIVNCITLNEVAKQCSSLRLILNVSWFSIVKDVGKGLRDFCEELVGLLGKPTDLEIDIQHIMLVVTQTPEQVGLEEVETHLEGFCLARRDEEKREGMNSDVSDFVEMVLLRIIQDEENGFVFSTQMTAKDQRGAIERGAYGLRQKIRKCRQATNPQRVLNVEFKEQSLDYLRNYVREVRDAAIGEIENQGSEVHHTITITMPSPLCNHPSVGYHSLMLQFPVCILWWHGIMNRC